MTTRNPLITPEDINSGNVKELGRSMLNDRGWVLISQPTWLAIVACNFSDTGKVTRIVGVNSISGKPLNELAALYAHAAMQYGGDK